MHFTLCHILMEGLNKYVLLKFPYLRDCVGDWAVSTKGTNGCSAFGSWLYHTDEDIPCLVGPSTDRHPHQIVCTVITDGASRVSVGWQGCGLWLVHFR